MFIFTEILPTLLILLACGLLGFLWTSKCKTLSLAEQFFFGIALGHGGLSLLLFILGLLGLISAPILLILLSAWIIPSRWLLLPEILATRDKIKSVLKNWQSPYWLLMALLICILIPGFLMALYPPIDWDVTSFHMAMTKKFVQAGEIYFPEYMRYPVGPILDQTFNILALGLFKNDILIHCLHFSYLIISMGLIATQALRYYSNLSLAIALGLLLASPLIFKMSTTGMIDSVAMMYFTAASLLFLQALEAKDKKIFAITGALMGFAVATKFVGLYLVIAALLLSLWELLKRRLTWQHLLLVAGFFLFTTLPWYVRNALHGGNPFFPMFTEWLGNPFWSTEELHEHLQIIMGHGLERNFINFIKLPLEISFNQARFHLDAPITTLYFFFLPFIAYAALKDRFIRYASFLIFLYMIGWFIGIQVLRHLMPIFALLSLISAGSIHVLLQRWPKPFAFGQKLGVSLAIIFLLALPGSLHALKYINDFSPLPWGKEMRTQFVNYIYPSYAGYAALNERYGDKYVVYSFYEEYMRYFSDGTMIGDYYGKGAYKRVFPRPNTNGEELYKNLKELNVGYLMFAANYRTKEMTLPSDDFFKEKFVPVMQSPAFTLYELK